MSAQGMAETVAWTTLYGAMVQDGIRAPLQPGTHVASWLREVVVEALFAPPARAAVPNVELMAKAIYMQWAYMPGWTPWVVGGNSIRQDDARAVARLIIEKENEQ